MQLSNREHTLVFFCYCLLLFEIYGIYENKAILISCHCVWAKTNSYFDAVLITCTHTHSFQMIGNAFAFLQYLSQEEIFISKN